MSVITSSCTGPASTVTYVNGTDTWFQSVQSALAPSIVVAYQSSDLSLWATPTSTSISDSASTSRPTETIVSPTATSTPSPGVSTGAQAGIGVGVTVLALLGFLAAGLWFWRHKKAGARDAAAPPYDSKAELSGDGVHRELGGDGVVFEKSSFVKPVEVGNDSPAELDGDWRGWEVNALPSSPMMERQSRGTNSP